MIFQFFPANLIYYSFINPKIGQLARKPMLYYILHVLADAAVIVVLSRLMPQIQVKDFTTAIIVAVLLGLLSFFLGWIIKLPLNLVTLFLLRGVVRIVVTAVILKLIDMLLDSFKIEGFWPAVVIAVAVAIVGYFFDGMTAKQSTRTTTTYQRTSSVSVAPMLTRV